MSYLRSYSPAPVSELHRVFGIKRSTLTSILDRLEARGWIERRASPRDRRALLVALTEAGRGRADRVQTALDDFEARISAEIRPDAWGGFDAVMTAIATVTQVSLGRGRTIGKEDEE